LRPRRALFTENLRDGYAGKFRAQLAARNAIDPARCAAMYGVLRDNGAWVTPTMVLELVDSSALRSPSFALLRSDARQFCTGTVTAIAAAPDSLRRAYYDRFRQDIATLHANGVGLLAGTDLGNPCVAAGSSLHEELAELVRAGLTPHAALATATVNPAIERETFLSAFF